MKAKKIITFIGLMVFMAGFLSACAALKGMKNGSGTEETGKNLTGDGTNRKKLSIVATIFPEYDWVKEILGENEGDIDVTLLLDNGVDLHSYQPTADDILTVSTCDLFIYVGGESDEWVEDALKEASNKEMKVIDLLDVLGDDVKEEEVVEGMEPEEEEEGDEEEEEEEYDEHVWLSLKNTQVLCDAIARAIQEIDPEHADIYESNRKAYDEKLMKLDEDYQQAVDAADEKILLFGDRFPFRYMTDDYGLDYYAAFVGCSAETEASFETITFLADKVDELGLKSIFTIDGSDQKIAETIRDAAKTKDDCKILTLDSMQSTTSADAENGTTYLTVMTQNLNVLKQGLK